MKTAVRYYTKNGGGAVELVLGLVAGDFVAFRA